MCSILGDDMERVILHSDLNNFYASVECLYHPELRNKPIAVAGDSELRHGIVLAKNYLAKGFGVKTGEALWQARQKCPDITFVPPDFEKYIKYSKMAREIYSEYTNQVESFGLDECWLDVSGSDKLFGGGKEIADSIRSRMKSELGVTVSVGVSFNKIFAKLGSDYKKTDATTVISRSSYREIVWELPVSALLYVGRATEAKLRVYGIKTIGDFAKTDVNFLYSVFGKQGRTLWAFANGYDDSPVSDALDSIPVKSIGNGTTTPRDLESDEDVKIIMRILSESVAYRLRKHELLCSTVQIGLRDTKLYSFQRQVKLPCATCFSDVIFDSAYGLYKKNHNPSQALRSISVRACTLSKSENQQLSLFDDSITQKYELEGTIDALRERFGSKIIFRGFMLNDRKLSALDPGEHVIHPASYFK